MLIIIEGCDATGKTTLANDILRAVGSGRVDHYGPPSRPSIEEYGMPLQSHLVDPMGGVLVCDRFHWGDRVYGPLYRPDQCLTVLEYWWLEQLLASRGGITVHTTSMVQQVVAREVMRPYADRNSMDPIEVGRVLAAFASVAVDPHTGSFTAVHSIDQPVTIGRLLQRAQSTAHLAQRVMKVTTSYIGKPDLPRFLLVGEQGNPQPGKPLWHVPFLPRPGTASELLWAALDAVGLRDFGMINALDLTGEAEPLYPLWNALGYPMVCALGAVAHTVLNSLDIPHGRVDHPQFVRRFHYADRLLYGQHIAEALTTGGTARA